MAVKIPEFKPEAKMPALVPFNIAELDNQAKRYDEWGYARSDADFKKRRPGTFSAEKAFDASVAKDWTGDTELMPEIQSEFMRAGLGSALGAFGDTGPVLGPNSAGEANVARNLGLKIADFQDRNRKNRMGSLAMAEEIFPRRTFGISGQDAALASMLNTQGMNSWNQAQYGDQIQQEQYNHRIATENLRTQQLGANANAAAGAQEDAAEKQAAMGAVSAVAGIALLALVCWIARAIFGEDNNAWRVFRNWLLRDAPKWIVKLYIFIGPTSGRILGKSWILRSALKPIFVAIVNSKRKEWRCATT